MHTRAVAVGITAMTSILLFGTIFNIIVANVQLNSQEERIVSFVARRSVCLSVCPPLLCLSVCLW